MEVEEIIFFMTQDKYYSDLKFRKSGKNDPKIMEYIHITDEDPNYLKNIELIKKNRIYSIFIDSKVENEFYSILLKQIKKIMDFKNIFDIFSLKNINKKFNNLLNDKMNEMIFTILDINPERYNEIFNIFNNWIVINHYNNLDLNYVFDRIFLNFDIPNKYFIYLLKNKTKYSERIIDFIKKRIIEINIELLEQNNNPDLLIELLLNSDDRLCLFFLEKINNLALEEKDFYLKNDNHKIILLKAFSKKCKILFEKYMNSEGTYTYKINSCKNKILKDLQKGNINFAFLKSLMIEDKGFENKIEMITLNDKEGKILYNKLNNYFQQFQNDFNNIDIILEYYKTFYPNSKEELIKLISIKQKEFKETKMIHELINMDIKNFFNIKNFYLKEAIEESVNLKYKNSFLFMSLYKNNLENYKLEKSEDKILKESINDYINTFKIIIEKLESKMTLYKINNIELIIN